MSRRQSTNTQNTVRQRPLLWRKPIRRNPPRCRFTFYEFFAGGGMARAGLGNHWKCLFANDFDFKKSVIYKANWGDEVLVTEDVRKIEASQLPGKPNLIWASFPCQDLSLAGMGAGLRGDRSGTFWPFWRLVKSLHLESRNPDIVVLENVCGTLTSHAGKDFTAIAEALTESEYRVGAVVIDAVAFLPQSRPRLFIIAVAAGRDIPEDLFAMAPSAYWHTPALRKAYERLEGKARRQWIWWDMPVPPTRTLQLQDLLEENPSTVDWHTPEETMRLLSMMSPINREKVDAARRTRQTLAGTVYRRTRVDEVGKKVQRAEVRFDGIAGCLRTPAGGSSRQVIFIVSNAKVRSRLISSRETARLMGLPDEYKLPDNYNEAYHLTGDGVVVPVISYLARHLLEPVLTAQTSDEHHSVPTEPATAETR